jgi:hypothetical protein
MAEFILYVIIFGALWGSSYLHNKAEEEKRLKERYDEIRRR